MGLGDTLGNKAEEAKGKIKEEWGDATDNTRLEAEGKAEQVKAKADQVGDDAADALQNARDEAAARTPPSTRWATSCAI